MPCAGSPWAALGWAGLGWTWIIRSFSLKDFIASSCTGAALPFAGVRFRTRKVDELIRKRYLLASSSGSAINGPVAWEWGGIRVLRVNRPKRRVDYSPESAGCQGGPNAPLTLQLALCEVARWRPAMSPLRRIAAGGRRLRAGRRLGEGFRPRGLRGGDCVRRCGLRAVRWRALRWRDLRRSRRWHRGVRSRCGRRHGR